MFRWEFLWVLCCITASSIEPIIVKLAYQGPVSPLQLLVMKNLVAAAAIIPLTRCFVRLKAKDVGRIASASLFLLAVNGLILLGLKHISAVTVITINTCTPACVALTNRALKRDSLSWRFWLGFAMCLLGVMLTIDAFGSGQFSQGDYFGFLCVGLAMLCTTTYRVRIESLTQDFPPKLVSTYIFLVNALAAVVFVAPFIEPIPTASLGIGLWIGSVAALANVAFVWAISMVGSTNMSMFNLIQRPLVIIAAALVLNEPLSPLQILGIVLVMTGIPLAKIVHKPSAHGSRAAAVH